MKRRRFRVIKEVAHTSGLFLLKGSVVIQMYPKSTRYTPWKGSAHAKHWEFDELWLLEQTGYFEEIK